ncbi:MAG: hypothetical protein K2Z81_01160, partial [Cyanobacteria bacterium]|nr:hypothetical protein [Cyanobacteriota bacterium]
MREFETVGGPAPSLEDNSTESFSRPFLDFSVSGEDTGLTKLKADQSHLNSEMNLRNQGFRSGAELLEEMFQDEDTHDETTEQADSSEYDDDAEQSSSNEGGQETNPTGFNEGERNSQQSTTNENKLSRLVDPGLNEPGPERPLFEISKEEQKRVKEEAKDPEINKLIDKLDDDDFDTRQAAQKELVDRGLKALPAIATRLSELSGNNVGKLEQLKRLQESADTISRANNIHGNEKFLDSVARSGNLDL